MSTDGCPSAPPPPAVPPTLSLADFLRQFSITKSPFEDHPPGISISSSTASSLSARQTAPTLEPTQIFYEPTLAQELEDGFLALLELHHSEDPSFQAALAMPLSLLAAFSLYGQDLISEARNVSHFQGTIGTSVGQMVGLYDQCIRPTKPRELHFLQETDNSGGRTLGTMLVRTDVCLREREGGKDKVLALIEFKRASIADQSVFAQLGRALGAMKRGDKLRSLYAHSKKGHALLIKGIQAACSEQSANAHQAPIHVFTNNLKWAVAIYDPSSTPPRLLISPFHYVVDTIADQQTSPSLFRILVSTFYRGDGKEDWVRGLPSWQKSEAVDLERSVSEGAEAAEAGRTAALSKAASEMAASSGARGGEMSDTIEITYPNSSRLSGTRLHSFSPLPTQHVTPPSSPPSASSPSTPPDLSSFFRQDNSFESTPASSTHTSPKTINTPPQPCPSPIHLSYLLAEGATSLVWSGHQRSRKVVVKIAKRGRSEIVRDEVGIASKLQGVENDLILPEGAYETSEGRVFTVMRDGGRAPSEWKELSVEHRSSLFLSLLRLHQHHHLRHNDAYPRNVAVSPSSASPSSSPAAISTSASTSSISTASAPQSQTESRPRWIDLTMAETGHECEGTECWELRVVWDAMELEKEENGGGEEVKKRAAAEGLVWEGLQGREVLV